MNLQVRVVEVLVPSESWTEDKDDTLTFWPRAASGPPLAHHFLFPNQPVTSIFYNRQRHVKTAHIKHLSTRRDEVGTIRENHVRFAHIFPSGSMNERLVSQLYILLQFWGRAEGSCESPLMLTLLTICPCAATPAAAPPCRVWVRLTWAVLNEVILPLPAICRLTVVA